MVDLYPPHEARMMAIGAHDTQKYGVHPYVVHLDDVAALVTFAGVDAQVAAFLHDALEDTDLRPEAIGAVFGARMQMIVEMLTDSEGLNRKARKAKTYERFSSYDVREPEPRIVLIVKAADRLANVRRCIGENNRELLQMYKNEHEVFVKSVHRGSLNSAFMDELDVLIARG